MCKTNSRPRRRWRVSIPALVCGVALCVRTSGAWADGLVEAPVWTFGGFGSVGLAHSSERHADYSANVLNPGGAGNTHRVSVGVDSRIGAQLGLNLNSQWSATLQVVSERNLQNSYRPAVEWATIKYQMTPDFSLRLGRIALPIFLAGDYRKAAYALPGARPPVEVYGTIPLASTDGIDASYRWHTTDFNHQTQVFFGHAVVKIDDNGNYARARQTAGLSNTASSGALTIRVSAMTAGLTVDLLKPLFDTFRLYGPQGAVLADTYGLDHKRATIGNLGISYDPGNWFVVSEISRFNTRSFLGDRTAFYATSGYRFGSLAPYLGYAKVRSNGPVRDTGLNLALLPPAAAPAAAYLNNALNAVLSTIPVQHTISAGARWDFMPNRALKVQYDRLLPQGGTSGTLTSVQPGFQSGRPVNVLSAALDFVF